VRYSFALVAAVLTVAACRMPSEVSAGRSEPGQSLGTLQRERVSLTKFMHQADRRMDEVRFLASQLDNIRSGLTMQGVDAIRSRAVGLERQLRDRRLRALFAACVHAMDGTSEVTATEQEAFLRLSVELESSMDEVERSRRRLRELQTQLANFVPPDVKRKMLRQAKDMLESIRKQRVSADTAAGVELEVELEEEACRLEPSRSRDRLRELRGTLALTRKQMELSDAKVRLAETLQAALADDMLTDDERRLLTRQQAMFSQLKHACAGMATARY